MSSDLTFLTNEPAKSLRDRFIVLLRDDTRFFDCLVGYFFISGFYKLHPALKNVEKIRILIGLQTDRTAFDLLERAREQGELTLNSHASVREQTPKNVLAEFENSTDSEEIEAGVHRFVEWIRSVTTTMKGTFPGIGMASVERDSSIAPAILELAETRAIARSLRFAGYGVEYCSAEEISHLGNGNGGGDFTQEGKGPSELPKEEPKGGEGEKPANGGNGGDKGGGNGNARISNKQLNYIVNLGRNLNLNSKDLDQETLKVFGVKLAFLTSKQASAFIDTLKERSA